MIDFIQIENDLIAWVKSISGLDDGHVIPSNDKGVRPLGQYVSLRILDPIKIGHDAFKFETNISDPTSVDILYNGLRQIMVSVNVYRDGTNTALALMASLTSLKTSLDRVLTQDFFSAQKLGIINTSETRDLSEAIKGQLEERRQTDFFFYITDTETETVEAIETITGTNLIDDEDYIVTLP